MTFLSSLEIPSSFLITSLEFSVYNVMLSANSDSFTSFPVWIPFIYFFLFSAVTRTSKTMLNKSGELGHPWPFPDLRGNAFSFSPLSMMLAVSLSYIAFFMLRYVPSMPSF